MIVVRCPSCAKPLKVRPELAGKLARCPGCATTFAVPRPATVPAEPVVVRDDPDDFVSELDVVDHAPEGRPVAATPALPETPAGDDEPIDADVEVEGSPAGPRKRRRKKRKRAAAGDPVLEEARYWLSAFGVFPWVMAGLCLGWLFLMVVSLLLPPVVLLAGFLASGMSAAGWIWIVLTAFRDDTFHGMLCVATPYWLIYPFLNLNEAWRPAVLTAVSFVMQVVSTVLFLLLYRQG